MLDLREEARPLVTRPDPPKLYEFLSSEESGKGAARLGLDLR
jgi:hypothetical protein